MAVPSSNGQVSRCLHLYEQLGLAMRKLEKYNPDDRKWRMDLDLAGIYASALGCALRALLREEGE